MTKNNKLNNQEELFIRDCKLMNLKYEYDGYTGTEKWAVVTELTEEELWDKYPDVIGRFRFGCGRPEVLQFTGGLQTHERSIRSAVP